MGSYGAARAAKNPQLCYSVIVIFVVPPQVKYLPSTHESKVVFPQPLGPRRAYTEPAATVSDNPARI